MGMLRFDHVGVVVDDLAAAAEAMRLLQDRQAHTPEEMLDPRETRVLKQLRSAVRGAMDEGR
jgi:hypothetical protein